MKRLHEAKDPHKHLVFASKTAFGQIDIKKPWQTALARAEITNLRFHDIRHHFCTLAARQGASNLELAMAMGHRTLQMLQRYTHLEAVVPSCALDGSLKLQDVTDYTQWKTFKRKIKESHKPIKSLDRHRRVSYLCKDVGSLQSLLKRADQACSTDPIYNELIEGRSFKWSEVVVKPGTKNNAFGFFNLSGRQPKESEIAQLKILQEVYSIELEDEVPVLGYESSGDYLNTIKPLSL